MAPPPHSSRDRTPGRSHETRRPRAAPPLSQKLPDRFFERIARTGLSHQFRGGASETERERERVPFRAAPGDSGHHLVARGYDRGALALSGGGGGRDDDSAPRPAEPPPPPLAARFGGGGPAAPAFGESAGARDTDGDGGDGAGAPAGGAAAPSGKRGGGDAAPRAAAAAARCAVCGAPIAAVHDERDLTPGARALSSAVRFGCGHRFHAACASEGECPLCFAAEFGAVGSVLDLS
jgi:hypothetical protein